MIEDAALTFFGGLALGVAIMLVLNRIGELLRDLSNGS